MSDYLSVFNFSKPFKKIEVAPPASRKNVPTPGMSSWKSVSSVCSPTESGTEYAKKYIEEEEKILIEQSKKWKIDDNKLDDVSVGTMNSRIADVSQENLYKIYRTYDFIYRPQQTLPVNAMKDKIVSMIDTNSVVVIEGPTGCGKTTQVPQFILDDCYRRKVHCNIIVTQPRRIAAVSIAKRVSNERKWPLGTLVGFKVGMLNKTSQDTRLTYCTTGVLLRHLINKKNMLDFTHVILDEVHERDQDMDFVLLVVRKFLRTNSRSVKVILMSATINVEKFASYFSSPINDKMVVAPILDIAKNYMYDIDKFYLCDLSVLGPLPEVSVDSPRVTGEMMDFCSKLIFVFNELDSKEHRHTVLIFLPGIWEIEEMHQTLTTFSTKNGTLWDILVLHSTITNEEQQKIFESPPEGYRRIILSTNIAESSITVPDVKYVVDFCLAKTLVTNRETNFQILETKWASKTNCDQRAGRTGRTIEGRVYRLVPKKFYEKFLEKESIPEILRAPLEHVVLNTKMLNMGSPKQILALSLDPPDLTNLERTIYLLRETGALLVDKKNDDPLDGILTSLGRLMASLPVNINVAKLIALGHAFGVLRSAIIIAASMSTKSVFSTPFQKKLQAYSMKLNWAQGSCSDCIAFLNVYNLWMAEKANLYIANKKAEKDWATRHFIQLRVLYEINTIVQELTTRLSNFGINIKTGLQNFDDPKHSNYGFVLKIIIAGAFYPNYFQNTNVGELAESENLKRIAGLDPKRTVFVKGWPQNQPGPLYIKNFQRVFRDCCGVKQMRKTQVTFDCSSRVYITFSSETTKLKHMDDSEDFDVAGKISRAVYRALKLRENGGIVVPLIPWKEANKIAKEMQLDRDLSYGQFFRLDGETDLILRNPELEDEVEETSKNPDDNIVTNSVYDWPPKLEGNTPRYTYTRPILPGLLVRKMSIIITKIYDPCQFYAQSGASEDQSLFFKIQKEINDDSKLMPLDHKPLIGEVVIVCAKEKSCNYRALIQNISWEKNQEKVGVFFVDQGTIYEVTTSELLQFKEANDVMEVPSLAFECTLMGVKPPEICKFDSKYDKGALEVFKKKITSGMLEIEIYSVVHSVVIVKLFCKQLHQQKTCINEWMVSKGYLDVREEEFLSKRNHEVRERVDELTKEQIEFYNANQYDNYDFQFKIPEITEEQCITSVTLKGPYSPLEMDLYSLIITGYGRKVRISSMSVNSVLLNTNLGDDHHRLVVAGQVHQSVTGSALNIDITTLMPNILGLTSLLVLTFAPTIELRRNRYGNRYSSVLCGLGHDADDQSLFPEHDMEIIFDVHIDNNDLLMVNKLRHWMNLVLSFPCYKEDYNEEVANCQANVQKLLMQVFGQNRTPQKREAVADVGKWKLFDEAILMKPHNIPLDGQIYSLHYALELTDTPQEFEELVEHNDELAQLALEDPKKHNQYIHCKFCDAYVFGIYELRQHLIDPKHESNVSKNCIPLI